MVKKKCKYCKKEFQSKQNATLYCSEECWSKYHKIDKRKHYLGGKKHMRRKKKK